MIIKLKGEIVMNTVDKKKKSAAKAIASILDSTLKADANSTSCYVLYQPSVPEKLSQYKKKYDKAPK